MDLAVNQQTDIKQYLLNILKVHISNAESYYWYTVKPKIKKSYKIYHADEDYYEEKFPLLSKSSNLVSTDVADTIEWALPSLCRIFFGSEDMIQLTGVNPEDEDNAKIMEELIKWQLQRKNNAFLVFYNWFKEALITGVGIVKCYWEREVKQQEVEEIMALPIIQEMEAQGIQITYGEMVDEFQQLYKVRYIQEIPVKNWPKIENVLASELRFSPEARSIEEAQFVAHKKRVTLNHMLKMQDMGYYSNVEDIDEKEMNRSWLVDDLEIEVTGLQKLTLQGIYGVSIAKANQYYDIYECYVDIDMEQNNRLKKMIITICGNTILRIEENIYGRTPFFLISPMKDPYRIWPKRSYSDLIGQLQDLKVGLTRQLMKAIALSNEPRMVVDESAVNIHDYIQNRAVIRKKPGIPMQEAIHPIPTQPLHPWTFNFLEYIEGQKENRTGITRYNQGLDAGSLNKTATGISAIMSASNQRLELIARMFLETGITELFRFLIYLNQKFVDQQQVIRLTNQELQVTPDNLQGDFDIMINAGVGMTTKEANMMHLQTILTGLMQALQAGIPIVTPENIYNVYTKWINEAGYKDASKFVTQPQIVMNQQLQQMIAQLPPELQEMVITGQMTPEQAMMIVQQAMAQQQGGNNVQPTQRVQQGNNQPRGTGTPIGGLGGGAGGQNMQSLPGQMVGGQDRRDNRFPQGMPIG